MCCLSKRNRPPAPGSLAALLLACALAGSVAWGEEWAEKAKKVDWNAVLAFVKAQREVAEAGGPKSGPAESAKEQPTSGTKGIDTANPAGPEPAWKPKSPGERRQAPAEAIEIAGWALKSLQEDYQEKFKRNDYRKLVQSALTMGDAERALATLNAMLGRIKRGSNENRDAWIEERIWQADMAMERGRMPPASLERFFQTWKERLATYIDETQAANPKYNRYYDDQRLKLLSGYYEADHADLMKKIHDLELAGENDPEPLWTLCERYQRNQPENVPKYILTLYKLRAWHKDYKQVLNGEVQWRLTDQLGYRAMLPKECVAEVLLYLKRHAASDHCTGGEALWRLAEQHDRYGEKLAKERNPQLARVIRKQASDYYTQFKKEYPKHGHNQPKVDAYKRVSPSDTDTALSRLEKLLD